MDEEELRDLLSKRLHIELQLFKDSMLLKEKEEIFKFSYTIEVYVNLYEICLEHMEGMDSGTLRKLLRNGTGILESIYQGWLIREDSFYDELKECARSELELLSEPENPGYGEEGKDGAGIDKAA